MCRHINPFKVLFEHKKFIIPYTFFYRKLQQTLFFKEQLKNFQIKMPPSATLRNDNSKINTAPIYLASNSLSAIKDKSKLPHNHLFKEPIKQSKSDVSKPQ